MLKVLQLKKLLAGFSPRCLGFDLTAVYLGFVIDTVALNQEFPRVKQISPFN